MKRTVLFWIFFVIPFIAKAGDYEITCERKKTGLTPTKGNVELKTSQNWTGEVIIKYHSFKPSPELEARYIIFVRREHLGQKSGEKNTEKIKGSAKVESMKPGGTGTFLTSEVVLKQAHLAPNWYMANGGSDKAEDGVIGVWIKLFDGGKEVADYANPSTVTTKFKFE